MQSQPQPTQRHGAWPSVGPSYPGPSAGPSGGRGGSGDHGSYRGQGRGRGSRGGGSGGFRGGGNRPRGAGRFVVEDGREGRLECGYCSPSTSTAAATGGSPACTFRTNSQLALTLHKADRHLVYPPGGKEELDNMDPLLIEERREAERRNRKRTRTNEQDGGAPAEDEVMNTIPGLNIALSTPELVAEWIAQRKKRWPSDKVVQKRLDEAWDDASRGQLRRASRLGANIRDAAAAVTNQKRKRENDDASSSGEEDPGQRPGVSAREADQDSDSDSSSSSSDSDSDSEESEAPSEEPIAKEPPVEEETTSQRPSSNVCRFFLQGRCNFGPHCKQSHEVPRPQPSSSSGPSKASPASHIAAHRRPRPRNPPVNPFEPRNLLHALLRNEINQHVSMVAQVMRFLVRNDFLKKVELHAGAAEEQARRRGLIRPIPAGDDGDEGGKADPKLEDLPLEQPLVDGGLPTVSSSSANAADQVDADAKPRTALIRPPSPLLRPLPSLAWPPEPDPMVFLDPLRRDDPKPLTHSQFLSVATDPALRSLLSPPSPLHPQGQMSSALQRAIQTLDDLPSDAHRRAALELILGVSAQTPLHPHQLGPTFVNQSGSEGGPNGRFIGEVELFKLGLRCGPLEQETLRKVAQRITEVINGDGDGADGGGPEFDSEPLGWDQDHQGRTFREEKRRRHWEKEADRRDMLRKLGLDVD
ncbi:unnamed protein product [Jaminaea pallidilutea]